MFVAATPSDWSTTSTYNAKLTASDGATDAFFGLSVGISENTVVAGAPQATIGSNSFQGAAYVFVVATPSDWSTTSTYNAKLTASNGATSDFLGWSVGISGNTVVAAAPDAAAGSTATEGAAYVFVEPTVSGVPTWSSETETQELTEATGNAGDSFGFKVGISGNTIVASAPNVTVSNMNQGAAYVFTPTTVGSFTLSAAPGSLTINPGGSGSVGTSTVTVTSTNGFTGSVSLSASNLPSGVTASFSPTSTTTSSTLTLTAGSSAAAGSTTVTITGMSGALTQTTTVTVTVAQDFSVPGMLANPAAANPGQLTSTTMLISPASGNTFTSNVTIGACTGLPTGLSCTYSQNQIASGSNATTITISVQTAGPFTGTASGATHRSQAQNQRLWLPLSVPLFGIELVGLAGRGSRRRYAIVGLCLALGFTGFLVACGSSNSAPAPTVTVTPGSVNALYPSLAGRLLGAVSGRELSENRDVGDSVARHGRHRGLDRTFFACPAHPAPVRTPGTKFWCISSIIAISRAISSRSCRGSMSICAARRRGARRFEPYTPPRITDPNPSTR